MLLYIYICINSSWLYFHAFFSIKYALLNLSGMDTKFFSSGPLVAEA